MSAREEVAELLCGPWVDRDVDVVVRVPPGVAARMAAALDEARLLIPQRPKSPEEMTPAEFQAGLEAASRAELERLRGESHP